MKEGRKDGMEGDGGGSIGDGIGGGVGVMIRRSPVAPQGSSSATSDVDKGRGVNG